MSPRPIFREVLSDKGKPRCTSSAVGRPRGRSVAGVHSGFTATFTIPHMVFAFQVHHIWHHIPTHLPEQQPEQMATNTKTMHSEGPVAEAIEEQTAKLPSDLFLWCALGAMAVSATLKVAGKQNTALFVGQWAAPFLLLGVYNKLVKLEGHDGNDAADSA